MSDSANATSNGTEPANAIDLTNDNNNGDETTETVQLLQNTIPSHKLLSTSLAIYFPQNHYILVLLFRSVHRMTLGYTYHSQIWLNMEECIWLMENGWLEVIHYDSKNVMCLADLYSVLGSMRLTEPTTHISANISNTTQYPYAVIEPRLYSPLSTYIVYSILRNIGNPVMRYTLYKHSIQSNLSAHTQYTQNELHIDVLCVWHAYRSSKFAKTRPIKPDYLLLILDTDSLTQQQYALPYLLQYAQSLMDDIDIKLAIVNEIGKVVFVDMTESNAIQSNATTSGTVQSHAIVT